MDDCILEILKYLNFNDRSSCRLVSHQLKRLVDSLPISKMVVFDRSPIQPGKFALIDETYSLQDCVYVFNLQTFFANKFILQRLDKIEKLVINGLDRSEFSSNSTFEKLTHLELRQVCIINPTILTSPNIKTLFLHDTHLNNSCGDYSNNGMLGFNSLKCKLNHFSLSPMLCTEMEFYRSCCQTGIFSELKTLDCYLTELKTLIFIGNNFPKLKTINVRMAKSRDDFIDQLDNNALGKLVRKLRLDLNVNIFGIPLNKSTQEVIAGMIVNFEFSFTSGCVGVLVNDDIIEYEDEHPNLLDSFFKQIDAIRFEDRLEDQSLYDKFSNMSKASYNFWLEVRHDLPDRFKAHPNISSLILTSLPDGHYLNDIMDMIPVHLKNLANLQMDQWDDANFDFLLQLAKLKTLRLFLRFEFDQSLFIEMLRNLKYLSFVEIFYERTDLDTKDRLKSFKKLIQSCASDELGFTDCVFKIELHHRTNYMRNEKYSFVRYILKRTARDSEENSLSPCENVIRKMMWCTGYKRRHPESSIEHDTADNIYRNKMT